MLKVVCRKLGVEDRESERFGAACVRGGENAYLGEGEERRAE